ncbi:histidinol dehydrogenase [Haliscomenobacter hydrossis]|uniref:Histidinol dehydrogenase n=1 Tax=Haliscomenobacter hydrossis (strain ATCC 27775 / DSM 1100 / LMG 10767 / O) TaxID=760192 RepID=F4KVG1_HALH1|nr:histidinol dehydrogenase [Haliscomenobacter hydrossis]AEE51274.1 Histidinol dehydrogenase [Haliscomenobacter hydrossis DSM 1100]
MKSFSYADITNNPSLLARPAMTAANLDATVSQILLDIRQRGDVAVKEYTLRFDKIALNELEVSASELAEAAASLDPALKTAIQTAKHNIETFHARQQSTPEVIETMPGVFCWRKNVGIDKVGLYIPGGTAPLFSTVLMLGVPAKLAGCKEVVLCSPPGADGKIHPAILFAAQTVGVTRIFKAGGVQAIGAMAYGTESIPRVYKIFGPGNQYVTAAKQLVSREQVAIDMPAGPSEVLVCADETADPAFVAADLLAQAEHGIDSQVVLLTFSTDLLQAVFAEVERQVALLPRAEITRKALENSVAVAVNSRAEALEIINNYAPEHLILAMGDADAFAEQVQNAGSVFIGNYTPESVGDYASGTNHTLPTNGYARAYSGVSLDSFVKKITFQRLTIEGLKNIGPTVETMAIAEELVAHQRAVSIRLEKMKSENLKVKSE